MPRFAHLVRINAPVQVRSDHLEKEAFDGCTTLESSITALQASESKLKQALEDAQQVNTQWSEYASTMGESNAALEAEVAALKEQAATQVARDGRTVRVEALFHRIDTDGSGTVERSEIMAVHKGGDWAALFDKLHANGDGMVTMEEWSGLFKVVEDELGVEKARFFLEYLEGGAGEKEETKGAGEEEAGAKDVEMARLQASEAELRQELEDAQNANAQWSEHASATGEAKAALEAEVAALRQQSGASHPCLARVQGEVVELRQALEDAQDANAQWLEFVASSGEAKAALEAEVAVLKEEAVQVQGGESELKQALEDAQQANTQWTEYASTMGESNATLEAEVAALKEQVLGKQTITDLPCSATPAQNAALAEVAVLDQALAELTASLSNLNQQYMALKKHYAALLEDNSACRDRVGLLENVATVQTKRLVRLEQDLAKALERDTTLKNTVQNLTMTSPSIADNLRTKALASRLQAQAERLGKIEQLATCLNFKDIKG